MATRRQFLSWTAASLSLPGQLPGGPARRVPSPLNSPAAAMQQPATRSDVGSLYPFIESQAKAGNDRFPLSYLQAEFGDVEEWKRRARERVFDLLHYRPDPCAADAEVVERTERDGLIREKVYFNTTPDLRVPAYVLMPSDAQQPLPGIVALHDHGGFYLWGKEKLVGIEPEHPVLADFKARYYAGNSIAETVARLGYAVIVMDMFYWGERRMLLDDDPPDWRQRPATISAERIAAFNQRASQSEQLVGRTIYAAGFTWSGVIFWDDIRTVDYLASRPEVDGSRIGCVGLSVGGLCACHLAALDERVKAAVVVGWMSSFPAQLRRHIRNTIGHTKLVPGLYRYMDYPDVASLAMPRALLVIQGSRDALFESDGVQACFDKLAACYRKAGVPDRFRATLYDAPHEFNAAMQQEAWDWLRRWV